MQDNLYNDIVRAMEILKLNCIPSRDDLKTIGMGYLSSRIEKSGGFKACAKRYNLPYKSSYRQEWNDDSIKSSITQMINDLHLERMPSRKEVDEYFGDTSLSNAISHRRKWYKLADELNLDVKKSNTYVGKKYEEYAKNELTNYGFTVLNMSQNFPYDLLVNDFVKIDVKASRLHHASRGNFYSYNLEKPYSTCDIYLLYLINDDGSVKDTLIIPSIHVFTNVQISVGEINSKYYKYSQKWYYIQNYYKFYKEVI